MLDELIRRHHGRVFGGAGVIAEFPSAVDAVACAVEIQAAIAKRPPYKEASLEHLLDDLRKAGLTD